MDWIDLVSPEQLQTIKNESQDSPVIIFKHSTTCAVSAMAYHRLQRKVKEFKVKFYYLDLRAYREVSNLIASTFNVIHESPQILIIDKGKAVYDRSHSEINPADILEVLQPTS